MTRFVFLLLVAAVPLVLPATPAAPVSTDAFTGRWEIIPRPVVTPVVPQGGRYNGFSSGTRKAGVYQVAYATMGEDYRVSPLSPPVDLRCAVNDWMLVGRTPGLDKNVRAVGTVWFFRSVAAERFGPWRVLAAELNAGSQWTPGAGNASSAHPAFPLAGWDHTLRGIPLYPTNGTFPDYGSPGMQVDATQPAPPQAPSVTLLDIDNLDLEFAYSWACNDSESPLSDVAALPKFVHPSDPTYQGTGFYSPVTVARKCIPPQGALGMYVYLRIAGTAQWHRQPCPHRDDWYVWDLDIASMPINRFRRTGVGPPAAASGRSYIAPIQQAMRDTDGNVLTNDVEQVCCPVISAYDGGAYSPAKGGHKFERTVGTVGAGHWELTDFVPPDPPGGYVSAGPSSGWAMWLENSQNTRLQGCEMRPGLADLGIVFVDHMGGGAFHFQGRDCVFEPEWYHNGDAVTYGIRVLFTSGPSIGDHTASETHCRDCKFNARFPVVVEGQNSANWVMEYTETNAGQTVDSAVLTIANANAVTFSGRWLADGGRCLIASRWHGKVKVDDLWIDQGVPSLLCVGAHMCPSVTFRGNKINCWLPWMHVVEAPAGTPLTRPSLRFIGVDSQSNGPVDCRCVCPFPGQCDIRQDDPVAIFGAVQAK